MSFVNLCFLEVVVFSKDTRLHKVFLYFSLYVQQALKSACLCFSASNQTVLVHC